MSDLSDRIRAVIEQEPVAIFMKGTPPAIGCGNSARALQALWDAQAPIVAVDILPDPEIRQCWCGGRISKRPKSNDVKPHRC